MPGPELTIGRVTSVEERLLQPNSPLDHTVYMAQVDTAGGIRKIHAKAVVRRGECIAFVSDLHPMTSTIDATASVAKYIVPVDNALSTVARVMEIPVKDVPKKYKNDVKNGSAHIRKRQKSMTPA